MERIRITSDRFEPDASMQLLMKSIASSIAAKLNKPLCKTLVSLDARSVENRTVETTVANLVTDIVRITYNTDCAMVVGGTIRSDCVFAEGQILTLGNIMDTFPFEDPVVVVNISGRQLACVLENGLSMVSS